MLKNTISFTTCTPPIELLSCSAGAPAPDQPSRRPLRAALLFADISDFTALTERLAQPSEVGLMPQAWARLKWPTRAQAQ